MTTTAILGVGKLGEALLAGWLGSGTATGDLLVSERMADRTDELVKRFGVRAVSPAEAAAQADVLVLAVKPQDMAALLAQLHDRLGPHQLVVSMAAGVTTAFLAAGLPEGVPIVRVMTNTPVLVDQAMSAISAGPAAGPDHLETVEQMLSPVGKVVRVPESQLDAVTALSGSGPAYFFYLVEAMIDAGILLGLPRALAHDLIVQTLYGSATMLRDSGEHPVILREAVTSPGGTTIMAIREMENHGVRAAMLAAIEAARDRSQALAGG